MFHGAAVQFLWPDLDLFAGEDAFGGAQHATGERIPSCLEPQNRIFHFFFFKSIDLSHSAMVPGQVSCEDDHSVFRLGLMD